MDLLPLAGRPTSPPERVADYAPSEWICCRGEFVVGLVADRVVAMGALRRSDDGSAKVTRMRIHPRHQRQGFGRLVLKRLETRARVLGYDRLTLDTTVAQKAARAFYGSHGYTETGRTRLGPFEVILFEKRLG